MGKYDFDFVFFGLIIAFVVSGAIGYLCVVFASRRKFQITILFFLLGALGMLHRGFVAAQLSSSSETQERFSSSFSPLAHLHAGSHEDKQGFG